MAKIIEHHHGSPHAPQNPNLEDKPSFKSNQVRLFRVRKPDQRHQLLLRKLVKRDRSGFRGRGAIHYHHTTLQKFYKLPSNHPLHPINIRDLIYPGFYSKPPSHREDSPNRLKHQATQPPAPYRRKTLRFQGALERPQAQPSS